MPRKKRKHPNVTEVLFLSSRGATSPRLDQRGTKEAECQWHYLNRISSSGTIGVVVGIFPASQCVRSQHNGQAVQQTGFTAYT